MAVDHKTMERMLDEANRRDFGWRSHDDYNKSFLDHLHREVQGHWEFMSWLKQTYPEALEAWIALKKLKGE